MLPGPTGGGKGAFGVFLPTQNRGFVVGRQGEVFMLFEPRGSMWMAISLARPLVMAGLALLLLVTGSVLGRSQGAEMGKSEEKKEQNLVITPAGPMPKENVHQVGPNEEVRREKDGSLVIVPRLDQRSSDK